MYDVSCQGPIFNVFLQFMNLWISGMNECISKDLFKVKKFLISLSYVLFILPTPALSSFCAPTKTGKREVTNIFFNTLVTFSN